MCNKEISFHFPCNFNGNSYHIKKNHVIIKMVIIQLSFSSIYMWEQTKHNAVHYYDWNIKNYQNYNSSNISISALSCLKSFFQIKVSQISFPKKQTEKHSKPWTIEMFRRTFIKRKQNSYSYETLFQLWLIILFIQNNKVQKGSENMLDTDY